MTDGWTFEDAWQRLARLVVRIAREGLPPCSDSGLRLETKPGRRDFELCSSDASRWWHSRKFNFFVDEHGGLSLCQVVADRGMEKDGHVLHIVRATGEFEIDCFSRLAGPPSYILRYVRDAKSNGGGFTGVLQLMTLRFGVNRGMAVYERISRADGSARMRRTYGLFPDQVTDENGKPIELPSELQRWPLSVAGVHADAFCNYSALVHRLIDGPLAALEDAFGAAESNR